MALRAAVQMDPPEGIDSDADSTFRLMLEAQERGHRLWICLPDDLGLDGGRPVTQAREARVRDAPQSPFDLGDEAPMAVDDFDVLLLRQDPPFDMHYITTTHLLEAARKTLVVNDPKGVRNAPEKLLVTQFADLMPPTLVSRDLGRIRAFRELHGDVVVKPLYGRGGEGVFRLRPEDTNFNPLLEMMFERSREAVMVQAFLPEVLKEGDRRLILVDGELAGGIVRMPTEGEARSNLHVGGRAEALDADPRDRAIAEAVGPALRERGLVFAGLDVIGGRLTEINVTSPTGLRELERLGSVNAAAKIWDAIEARLQQ